MCLQGEGRTQIVLHSLTVYWVGIKGLLFLYIRWGIKGLLFPYIGWGIKGLLFLYAGGIKGLVQLFTSVIG